MKKPQKNGVMVSAASSQISPVYANAIAQTAKKLIIDHSTLTIDSAFFTQDLEGMAGGAM